MKIRFNYFAIAESNETVVVDPRVIDALIEIGYMSAVSDMTDGVLPQDVVDRFPQLEEKIQSAMRLTDDSHTRDTLIKGLCMIQGIRRMPREEVFFDDED